jgi:CopG family nickel-responsive transcriptional regulator
MFGHAFPEVKKMSKVVRFGVSLDGDLLGKFDRLIRDRHYTNRSEAIRDLIRQEFVKREWEENREVAGAVTFIFDHHQRALVGRIVDIQHDFLRCIVSTQHIHMDHDHCLEIVAVRGKAKEVLKLADRLKSLKGVQHAALSMTGIGVQGKP